MKLFSLPSKILIYIMIISTAYIAYQHIVVYKYFWPQFSNKEDQTSQKIKETFDKTLPYSRDPIGSKFILVNDIEVKLAGFTGGYVFGKKYCYEDHNPNTPINRKCSDALISETEININHVEKLKQLKYEGERIVAEHLEYVQKLENSLLAKSSFGTEESIYHSVGWRNLLFIFILGAGTIFAIEIYIRKQSDRKIPNSLE